VNPLGQWLNLLCIMRLQPSLGAARKKGHLPRPAKVPVANGFNLGGACRCRPLHEPITAVSANMIRIDAGEVESS
jgi:hypothetical protein